MPLPVPIKDKPRPGQVVYRVYQYPGGDPYGKYWTPVDPRTLGPKRYREDAGLPDQRTLGNCLIYGSLRDGIGVVPGTASRVSPPASYAVYKGGLVEYQIEGAQWQVLFPKVETLDPPYGGDPLSPPKPVPTCPAVA